VRSRYSEVVVAYGRILPEGFLQRLSNGAINVHFPCCRNIAVRAPVSGRSRMVKRRYDHADGCGALTCWKGDILLQRKDAMGPDEDFVRADGRLSLIGAETFVQKRFIKTGFRCPVCGKIVPLATPAPYYETRRFDRLVDVPLHSHRKPRPGFFFSHFRLHILSQRAKINDMEAAMTRRPSFYPFFGAARLSSGQR